MVDSADGQVRTELVVTVLQHGEEADFEALNSRPTLDLVRSTIPIAIGII